ncbi:MAG: hypothetical protein RAO94_00730, partial [Candidatus Stygibacter australis]|nr:hypothetical protein [Candidatus Stygibacter australis]
MKKTLLLILLLTVLAINLHSVLIDVPDWDNDVYSIQDGIDLAVDTDTVLVAPGTYYENINFLGKKITVTSEYIFTGYQSTIEATIIDGWDNDSVVRMESGEDTLSYLCGFVIRNGNFYRGGGIHIFRSGAKLENLKIRNNISESEYHPRGGGIYGDGDIYNMIHPTWQDIIIRNVEISNNTVTGNSPYGGGIHLCRGINLVVIDNVTVTNNHCEGGSSASGGGG